jgi:fumarate hydratase subunit beta
MEYHLTVPLKEDDVKKLNIGDIVYLSGIIYTGRDEVHIHALELAKEGKKPPVDFKDMVLFHCGPVMQKDENGEWHVIAAGPTTSSRMNSLEPDFIERFGVKAIIGKGGMSEPTVEAMKKHGAVYLAMTGGAAALAASAFKKVHGVEWFEFGMPEAIWILEAEDLGPLVVGIDSHGNSIYRNVDENVAKNRKKAEKTLGISE